MLHRKEVINALSGELLLDVEVEREYNLGYEHLPRSIHKWFQQPLEHVLAQSVEQKIS